MRVICAAALSVILYGLGPAPAGGQTIPLIGTASTFEVASWNLEWFGSQTNGPFDEDLQLQNVARVMREADIDLWAVQEVDDRDHFRKLVDELGEGWEGELSTAGSNFKLGYVYKSDAVFVRQKAAILTQFSRAFAGRPPLQIEADVIMPEAAVRCIVITLHMKAFDDAYSYGRRVEAASLLKSHVDLFFPDRPVIVLGDFNDELAASVHPGWDSPYAEWVADANQYAFLTLPLDEAGMPTWCGDPSCAEGSTFDHIVVSDELFEPYVDDSAGRFEEVVDGVDGYTSTTSDHLPVFALFRFAIDTAVDERPDETRLRTFPNPFSDVVVVEFATRAPGSAVLTLYDALGRAVQRVETPFRAPGTYRIRLDGSALGAGVYGAVVEHPDGMMVRHLVRVP